MTVHHVSPRHRARPLAAPLRAGLLALPAALLALPAAAELHVQVSRTSTGRFESVGITVRDPRGGLDAELGPLSVTMADGADRRQTFLLDTTDQPGEWYGRFTPLSTGRFTGTAVLARGEARDIGLVPLVRVRPSRQPGFVRLHRSSQRVLQYATGGSLFPIGVRLSAEDFRSGVDWRAELGKLRARGVTMIDVPLAWPGNMPDEQRRERVQAMDALLLQAERVFHLALQMRLQPPPRLSDANAAAYEEQLGRWVRRWSYSPAVATWYVAGAGEGVSPELRSRFIRAVRQADSYNHLVAVPGSADAPPPSFRLPEGEARADLVVAPWNWQRPANRFALLEMPEGARSPAPLPGESSWQSLVIGGIGLPFWPYHPGAEDNPAFLQRLAGLSAVARSVPYHVAPAVLPGVIPPDTPGAFCRYGKAWLGWLAPDRDREVTLPALPRGRYRVRLWDPGNDVPLPDALAWSDGGGTRIPLPANLQAVYLQVEPTKDAPPPKQVAVVTSPPGQPEPKETSKEAPGRPAPPERKPARQTAGERQQADAAARKARLEEKRKAARPASRAERRAQEREAAARKAEQDRKAKADRNHRASKEQPRTPDRKHARPAKSSSAAQALKAVKKRRR